MSKESELRQEILELTKKYYIETFKKNQGYSYGEPVKYAARVFDENEIVNLVDSSLDFWLTYGRYSEEFEKRLSDFLDIKFCSLTNSGSSANLLSFMALTSHLLGERQIKRGDEVITVAAGFPTTISPIILYGATPVFVDISLPSYNIDVTLLESALTSKTKAVIIAHTLGNPFNIKAVTDFCKRHNLWLIEDNCDALGSKYKLGTEYRFTGSFGDISTYSFYPPHHITMGEGGAVCTNNKLLYKIINSFRDWGRDCWCRSGVDNSCGNRLKNIKYGELPLGYDHKYVYSHFGYNLKATDMQAAIGVAQIEKLDGFIEDRRNNWLKLHQELKTLDQYLILPEATENSIPSWFGYVMTVREDAPFTRNEIVRHLDGKSIQTRNLFAGNYIKQPCFDEIRGINSEYKVCSNLKNTDLVMHNSFWIGVYPGMTIDMLKYMTNELKAFIWQYNGGL